MTPIDFRKELVKIMPGYEWTVHKSNCPEKYLEATGVRSSGFNRLSTLSVLRIAVRGEVSYEAKSAGYGKRAPWLHTARDTTLARALRSLQTHYEVMAANYGSHASHLREARK